jgi:hypothetical protein
MSFSKSNNKAIYIDTFSINTQHENFNAAVLYMCNQIFSSVSCICNETNFINISKIAKLNNSIKFKRVYVIKGNSKYSLFFRYLFSSISNVFYILLTPKDSVLILPFNNLFSLRILNWLNKYLKRKILIFCHGELEGLSVDYNPNGILAKIIKKLSINFFLNNRIEIQKSIYFVILGDKLLSNLSSTIDRRKLMKFISLDHPYFFEFKEKVSKSSTNKKLHLGTIGSMSNAKGYLSLIKFLQSIENLVLFSYEHIGKFVVNKNIISKFNFDRNISNIELSRNEYNEIIESLDYILFFYPTSTYKLTASGAVLDSILHEKPILALKNDYFQYLFEKFGPFGNLYENIEQMISDIPNVLNNQNKASIDFNELKNKLSPNYISKQLHSELKRIQFI